jgi:hypothetical protein
MSFRGAGGCLQWGRSGHLSKGRSAGEPLGVAHLTEDSGSCDIADPDLGRQTGPRLLQLLFDLNVEKIDLFPQAAEGLNTPSDELGSNLIVSSQKTQYLAQMSGSGQLGNLELITRPEHDQVFVILLIA